MAKFFKSSKPHYEYLRKKWLGRHRAFEQNLWSKHGEALRQVAIGSLGGLALLSAPATFASLSAPKPISNTILDKSLTKNILLASELTKVLPAEVQPLSSEEEGGIIKILSKELGMTVKAEIDGIRLNRNYGLIGGEQHLYRYPGDNLYAHLDNTVEWAKYADAGIAPGLGAWGYFAPSQAEFDQTAKLREKYYLAIQTFLVPGYAENVAKYRDFFRFRKMVVVNPHGGQAVVAVIGDAGPAEWTGKHLGGSPEVMDELGLASGPRKGSVLYFFIDDPQDKIPLGPIKILGGES